MVLLVGCDELFEVSVWHNTYHDQVEIYQRGHANHVLVVAQMNIMCYSVAKVGGYGHGRQVSNLNESEDGLLGSLVGFIFVIVDGIRDLGQERNEITE